MFIVKIVFRYIIVMLLDGFEIEYDLCFLYMRKICYDKIRFLLELRKFKLNFFYVFLYRIFSDIISKIV